ncbi:hypothetical protein P8452_19362 [Trifolium repens]|nr:hypothetical protein P8452_19362 [Trifolium repens]
MQSYHDNNIMNLCYATLPPTSRKKESFHSTSESENKLNEKLLKLVVKNSMKLLPPISRFKKILNNFHQISEFIYTSRSMILLKSAIKYSMEKNGGIDAMFAKTMIIKAKHTSKREWHERRKKFQTKPSRLCYMSDAQDIPRNFKSFYYQGSLYINSSI